MAFPSSPTNGQQAIINGVIYIYNSTKSAWIRSTYDDAGNISALTANITGNVIAGGYFIGDGSQLTGITTDATSITNGTSNVKAYSNSNVTVSVNGTANVVTVTSNTLYAPNIYLANSQGGSGATIWYNPDSGSIDFVIG